MHDLDSGGDQATEGIKIGCVGGGSRSWALTLMNDLALCPDLSGRVYLYDVDEESARRNEVLGNRLQQRDGAVGEWEYVATADRATALDGADFVVVSTQDPPDETFAHDCDVPKQYGIYQTVGDTVGPGGTFRGMRAVPQYREIAAAVRDHCPDALVVNFTNPMTVCTRTLYEEFPEINAVGLCHEVFGVQGFLAYLAEEYLDADSPSRDAIDVNVKGINHFTWIDEARWRGHDLLALVDNVGLDEPVPRFSATGRSESPSVNNKRITVDLFRRFGVLPAAGDRHLAEFVPWYLDVADPDELSKWNVSVTSGEGRKDTWERGERRRDDLIAGTEPFEFHDSGEEVVDILRAWLGLGAVKTNVNLPNRGQVAGVTDGAVVETNALVTERNVTPLVAGPLPGAVDDLVATHVRNQELLVRAGFAGDPDLAFQAFLNDPLVSIDTEDAAALFAELAAVERDYLAEWDLDGAAVTR